MKQGAGEDRLLRWLRARLDAPLIGDDAAVLPAGGPFAVTVDSQIAGVHFTSDLDPALLARRLLAVNLSDLAAMGALPAYGFLALATPPGFDHRRFFRAFLHASRQSSLCLAGGDLAASPHTVATLTLLGTKPPRGRWVRRAGAVPGHALWLGGTVGESAAGRRLIERGARLGSGRTITLPGGLLDSAPPLLLRAARRAVRRHLLPTPQIELGTWLGRQREGAAIDVSDGVARDLHRLCRESRAGKEIGAVIDAESLPCAVRFRDLCAVLGADPLALALAGGEDYVLLFTLPSKIVPPARFSCRRIGGVTSTGSIVLRQSGAERPLPPLGWDHLAQLKTPARSRGG
jgi:thiamine-monophosphate kinase